jgi:hypothetical protein
MNGEETLVLPNARIHTLPQDDLRQLRHQYP